MIVKDYVDYTKLLDFISRNTLIAYDIETTGLNIRKDSIVGIGLSNGSESFYICIQAWNGSQLIKQNYADKVTSILELLKGKKLIAHNAYFDIEMTLNAYRVDLWDSLYADTICLVHAVQEEGPFELKELASTLWGISELEEQKAKDESVKKNGGLPGEMYKADADILGRYCEKDCEMTIRLFNYYSKKLEAEGLVDFFYNKEVMPLYKEVTRTMLNTGVPLDMPMVQKTYDEIQAVIEKLEDDIQESISEYSLGIYQTEYLNKHYPVKPSGNFAQAVVELFNLNLPKTKAGKASLTAKAVAALPDSIYKNFLQGNCELDNDTVLKVQKYLLAKNEEEDSIFNVNSKKHLGKLFFEYYKETPLSYTDKGNPQVNDKFLVEMAKKYKWVADLRDSNKLGKLNKSYLKRFLTNAENGLFYANWKQFGTTSSRYSGDFQQLPKAKEGEDIVAKYTSMIRNFIIAPEGYKLICADYNQLEVCVFAHDSKDEALLNAIKNGEDIYSKVGIDVTGVTGYSAKKKDANYLKEHKPEIRQQAKSYTLGIRYGLEAFKLARDLKISQDAAQNIIDRYFKSYPKLKIRMDELRTEAATTGKVVFESGRIRHLPDVKDFIDKYGFEMLDALEVYKEYNETNKYTEMKDLRKRIHSRLNNALNAPIQGMASHIVNQAGIKMMRQFKARNMRSVILLCVHDEFVLLSPQSEAEEAAKIMQDCMENTTKLLVPLTAKPVIGTRYGDIK